MTKAVDAHPVQRVGICSNPLTIAYNLRCILRLEQAEIGPSRPYLLRQHLGIPISLARTVAKHSGRESDEFVRVAAKFGKRVDLAAAQGTAERCIFCRERVGGRAHSHNLLHLRRHHGNVEPSKLLACNRHIIGGALLEALRLYGNGVPAGCKTRYPVEAAVPGCRTS